MNIALKIFFSLIIFISTGKIYSQCDKIGGIYLSIESYNLNKFDDSLCLDNPKNKIYTGLFNRLIIKRKKKKEKFKEGEIFAYQSGNKIYIYQPQENPFDDYGYFPVSDTTGLIIYVRKEVINKTPYLKYYYSVKIGSKIKRLTINNLKTDFNNDEFISKIIPYVESIENKNADKRKIAINKIQEIYSNYFR